MSFLFSKVDTLSCWILIINAIVKIAKRIYKFTKKNYIMTV